MRCRNPFGYEPWRDKRTYDAMFEILEADIVVMQETKIQRRDLSDDMVLVPGWDVYFSLPKYKKGTAYYMLFLRQNTSLTTYRLLWRCHLHEKLKVLPNTSGGRPHRCSMSSKIVDQLPGPTV